MSKRPRPDDNEQPDNVRGKKKPQSRKRPLEEDEIETEEKKNPAKRSKQSHASTMVWNFENQFNGTEQVVPCPFVSNDLVELRNLLPVKMTDEKGNLICRSIHEKDHEDEDDDQILGLWTSGITGITVPINQFRWNLVGTDFTIVMYGKRRTGKTHFLKALCYQLRPYFAYVIVFTKTKFNGDLKEYFADATIIPDMDASVLMDILAKQKERVKEAKEGAQPHLNYRLLLVFDDVLSADVAYRYNKLMETLFYEGRHCAVSVLCTSQDSKGLPPALKQNTDIHIMFPMQARRDRDTIADNVTPFLHNDQDLRSFLQDVTYMKHQFLAVVNCKGARPLEEQVYTGIITPEGMLPTYVMGSWACWEDDIDQLTGLGYEDLATDPSLITWNIHSHMPMKPKPDKREDGMRKKAIDYDKSLHPLDNLEGPGSSLIDEEK